MQADYILNLLNSLNNFKVIICNNIQKIIPCTTTEMSSKLEVLKDLNYKKKKL